MTKTKQMTTLQTIGVLSNAQYYLWSMHKTSNFYLQHCDLAFGISECWENFHTGLPLPSQFKITGYFPDNSNIPISVPDN